MAQREDLIRRIVRQITDSDVRRIVQLTGGQVGHVFHADTDDASYVVKFVAARAEPPFAAEAPDDRVYGSRWSNLRPAYDLLKENGIAVPTLHVSGTLLDEHLHYAVSDFLGGDADDYSPAWFACLGRNLGTLHRITRSYQGWVAMDTPYAESWSAAFAVSLRSRFATTAPLLSAELSSAIRRIIETHADRLTEPDKFVFSHTDGFQGVFARGNGAWNLLGVIDIEDHQFTDRRFALAGLELSHAFSGRSVPQELWQAYSDATAVPQDYAAFKPLFQLYYLLVWTKVLAAQPVLHSHCLSQLATLVREAA